MRARKFSEAVDIEAVMTIPASKGAENNNDPNGETPAYQIIEAKPTTISLKTISFAYGWSQVVTAFVGGFASIPAGKH